MKSCQYFLFVRVLGIQCQSLLPCSSPCSNEYSTDRAQPSSNTYNTNCGGCHSGRSTFPSRLSDFFSALSINPSNKCSTSGT